MTITNHMLAGSIIGLTINEPMLAIAVALGSHFVMDALPHFGYAGNKGYGEALKHKLSYQVGVIAAITTIALIGLLSVKMEWLALVAGIVAILPDALGVYNYKRYEEHGRHATGLLKLVHVKFHRQIQRYERPWGIYIEVIIAIGLAAILIELLS